MARLIPDDVAERNQGPWPDSEHATLNRLAVALSAEVHRVNTAKRLKQAIDNNWCIYHEQQAMEHKTLGMPSGKSEQTAKILDL